MSAQVRMPNYPSLPHDDRCELTIAGLGTGQTCKCAAREAAWVARERQMLAEYEWIARVVTGTPTETPLKRGAEWQARRDALQARRARVRANKATGGQVRAAAILAYIKGTP